MNKNLKKEARIITEKYDSLYADGIKKTSGLKDDDWGGQTHQVRERFTPLSQKQRIEILNCINEKFNTLIDIHDEEFSFNGKCVILRDWCYVYPADSNCVQRELGLSEIDAYDFRGLVGDLLACIPGGMQYFRDIAEASPFYLVQIR